MRRKACCIAGIIGFLCLSCIIGSYAISLAAGPSGQPGVAARTAASGAPTIDRSGNNIVLKGAGTADTPDFSLKEGNAAVHIELYDSGTGYSIVLKSRGTSIKIPFDTFNLHASTGQPGIKDTVQTINVPKSGSYYIQVNYGGNWQITVTQ